MTAPTLLITRPRPQCAAWLARLAALGVHAAMLPLIEILPARDPTRVGAAWAALPAADLAVFVSPNAVEHFFASAGGAAWPVQTLAACVGPGSAQALAARSVPAACIVQPAADAASLDSEHLWAQLAPRRDWAGARVEAVTVYHRSGPRLDAAEQALLDTALADPARFAWLFSSAEAIGHLRGLCGAALAGQRAIATHPRIAEAARAAGFAPVVLARPDPEAVTQALKGL